MIQSVWPYLAVMLLAAGLFAALGRRTGWKFFSIFPPDIQDTQGLLARPGYILGTGSGLLMATVFSSLAPAF